MSADRVVRYFVLFERDASPWRLVARDWLEFSDLLGRLVVERGPLSWMQRIYE